MVTVARRLRCSVNLSIPDRELKRVHRIPAADWDSHLQATLTRKHLPKATFAVQRGRNLPSDVVIP